jgi:hypothetical protein
LWGKNEKNPDLLDKEEIKVSNSLTEKRGPSPRRDSAWN